MQVDMCECGHKRREHDEGDGLACYHQVSDWQSACECTQFIALPKPPKPARIKPLRAEPIRTAPIRPQATRASRRAVPRMAVRGRRQIRVVELSDEQVREIRELNASSNLRVAEPYLTLAEIGSRYGLSSAYVSLIVRGKSRKSAGGPMRESWVERH